jgi:hypothetical protein
VLFAGSDGPAYRQMSYPLIHRSDVLDTLRGLGVGVKEVGSAPIDIEDGCQVLLVASTSRSLDNPVPNPLLAPPEYLRLLARSHFMVAAPGVVMPHCHNVVEGMAVGSVPILNYGDLFFPPLVNGENCLSFSSPSELREQVVCAVNMDRQKLDTMRAAVLDYYDLYLRPAAFGERLAKMSAADITLCINGELGRGLPNGVSMNVRPQPAFSK